MAELYLLVGIAITAFETISLIGVEVADRADFEPTSLRFRIYFEIVADGRGEALVTTTKTKDAIGEFELFQKTLYMVKHFLMALFRVLRLVDAHNLNLGELVQTIQTTYIFSV